MSRTDPQDLPSDVLEFIDEHVDSIPELEALLLLQETAPQPWDTVNLARRLYVYQEEAESILAKLRQLSFAVGEETRGFQFNIACREAELIARLAQTYRKHLSAVTRVVHNKPSPGVREFARAFTIKKDRNK